MQGLTLLQVAQMIKSSAITDYAHKNNIHIHIHITDWTSLAHGVEMN